ncbi:acyl-CoA dehydrogenase, partial [Halobacteriales archaeon SW_7_71_33]
MLDYVSLEADLDSEERLIRDTAREFVEEMGELGFYAPNLDGQGLPGVSETAYGLLMQELEAGDSGVRSMASVQGALVMYPVHEYGS